MPLRCSQPVLLAGCGSGESILQAGNEAPPPPPSTTQPPPTVPGQTTIPPASTTPPTTIPRPIDSLPTVRRGRARTGRASGPVELLFWHGLSNENGRTMEQVVEQYNQSQDRVHVSLEFQGGYEQTIDKYLQSNTDNRPDLVQMPEYATQLMIDTHSSVPMQACMEDAAYDSSALLPNTLDAYASEGIQWSMPFNLSIPVLYYNKKILRDAGLDPDKPPLTLAEVSEYGRTIQQTVPPRTASRSTRARWRWRLVPRAMAGQGGRVLQRQRQRSFGAVDDRCCSKDRPASTC